MHFRSYVSQFDPQSLAWARLVHARIFGELPLEWRRHATWIEAWNGRRRVAFAPHKSGASLYFQGFEAVNEYRRRGGTLRTGKVAIKIPQGADFEAALLRQIVVEYLGME
jgi:hypothetical protein